ncbi:hypothetical protein AAVH_29368 [Aphelenchoides avenae]|nr:hypothetical protein AAVH_29368 [Aphelenchus avenae]
MHNDYFQAFDRLMPVWMQLYEDWQLSRILLDVLAVDVLEALQNRLPAAHLFLMIACISRVGFIRGDVFAAWFCALPELCSI